MADYSEKALKSLSKQLKIDAALFLQCVQESVVEIRETEGHLELSNGTVLRLRRLERVCQTFDVDVEVALVLMNLVQRVTDLQKENQKLKTSRGRS